MSSNELDEWLKKNKVKKFDINESNNPDKKKKSEKKKDKKKNVFNRYRKGDRLYNSAYYEKF